MQRITLGAAAILAAIATAAPASAQISGTVKVVKGTVVLESPRGDSIPLSSVRAGEELTVLDRQGNWLLVSPPESTTTKTSWERGWIHASSLDTTSVHDLKPERTRTPGRLMIRGFGGTGGTLFSAENSFDTILGSQFGVLLGGGGQVVFPNGAFVQVSVERFQDTGSRALVSGDQIFTLDVPARITVRPTLVSVGYRAAGSHRYVPYLGAGGGWHSLKEESPTLPGVESVDESKIGYHVFGGVEFPLGRWAALAGEVQWTTVPDALGDTGVSAVFEEDDLGGTTFRFKFLVGF